MWKKCKSWLKTKFHFCFTNFDNFAPFNDSKLGCDRFWSLKDVFVTMKYNTDDLSSSSRKRLLLSDHYAVAAEFQLTMRRDHSVPSLSSSSSSFLSPVSAPPRSNLLLQSPPSSSESGSS